MTTAVQKPLETVLPKDNSVLSPCPRCCSCQVPTVTCQYCGADVYQICSNCDRCSQCPRCCPSQISPLVCPSCDDNVIQTSITTDGGDVMVDKQMIPLLERLNLTKYGTLVNGCHYVTHNPEKLVGGAPTCRLRCDWDQYRKVMNLVHRTTIKLQPENLPNRESYFDLKSLIDDKKRYNAEICFRNFNTGYVVYVYMKQSEIPTFCQAWDHLFSLN